MCSLQKFPTLPMPGQINVCEFEGRIQSLSIDNVDCYNNEMLTNAVSNYPSVKIGHEIGPTISKADISKVFLPGGDAFLKEILTTWYEDGLFAALSLATREIINRHPKLARKIQLVIDFSIKLRDKLHPQLREKGENLTISVSQCRDWSISPIRCLDWHPNISKIAVAVCNDSVRVYSLDTTLVPVLKCQQQSIISCLAWRPYSIAELAVGCQNGVFLWTVDPSSVSARPSASCAIHLKQPHHSPVTSVAWSPDGDILATASAADATMYIWDPAQERNAPLRRLGGGGVCLATWSPIGDRLLAATAGVVFRVWCTKKWIPERWTVQSGRVQTACWSPCGTTLLFCTTAEPVVYCLRFDDAASAFGTDDIRAAMPVIDLTPVEISEDGERAGGLVTTMVWDRRGHYLAIVFKETNVVAIFRTALGINLNVTPCCFVNGLPGEVPSTVAFQRNFEEGALLSIAWSSGRLQYFPIISSDLEVTPSVGMSRNHSTSRLHNLSTSQLF